MLKNLYLICGKSGSGKTAIVEILAKKFHYKTLKSYTTRKPRHRNDDDHIYTTISHYLNTVENKHIAASTIFDHHYYWSTVEQIENSDLYVIDKTGIEQLKQNYHGGKKTVVIYIETDEEICIERMRMRGNTYSAIWTRMRQDAGTFNRMEEICDFMVDGCAVDSWKTVAGIIDDCEQVIK